MLEAKDRDPRLYPSTSHLVPVMSDRNGAMHSEAIVHATIQGLDGPLTRGLS